MSLTDGPFVTLPNGVEVQKVALVRSSDGGDASASAGPTATNGYVQITATGTAFGLGTAPNVIPADATTALIQIEAQSVRYRPDAATPTTTVGFLFPAGTTITLRGAEIAAARFIAVTAGAILNVYFSK